ncbi:MAG: hypothetical protein ACLUNQ_04525 [Oscillospiraceae bacterium]
MAGFEPDGTPRVENVPVGLPMSLRGWYDHGKYPFVFDVLFPEEGTPCGYGYIDLCKSPQKQIDLMNQADSQEHPGGGSMRFFVRADGGGERETNTPTGQSPLFTPTETWAATPLRPSTRQGWTACMWRFCRARSPK